MDRGFDGTIWDRLGFQKHLDSITLPSWIRFLVLHATAAPNLAQQRATTSGDADADARQRMKNFWGRVLELGGRGWHLTVFENGKIGKGTDLRSQGIHAHSWNDESLGLEMCMDGSSNDPNTQEGKLIAETAAWVFSRLLNKLKLPADATTIKYHNEEPRAKANRKPCPGTKFMPKAEFIKLVKSYVDGDKPISLSPEALPYTGGFAPKATWSSPDVQAHLKRLGYDVGPIDGVLGPRTEAAIRAFQKAMGVVETGRVGEWLWNKMRTLEAPSASEPLSTDKVPVEGLHPSEYAVSWMKRFEGLRLEAYDDVGSWAIGYGHNATSKRLPIPYKGMKITAEEADKILHADAEAIAGEVRKVLKGKKLKQHQFDALVLHNFQMGQTQFTKTKAVQNILNDGTDAATFAAMVEKANNTLNKGLQRRRLVETQIWNGEKPTRW